MNPTTTNVKPDLNWQPIWQRGLSGVTLSLMLVLCCLVSLAVSAQTIPVVVQEGYVLLDRGWVNDAIVTFQQAVQSYPQSVEAQLGLAIAYQRAGQDTEAWQVYQQVLSLDPRNQRALTAVGVLGGYRPEWQPQGIEALTTLLDLTPDDRSARAQRALLYSYQGLFVESIADYERLLSVNPAPDVLLGAAQAYTFSGDYQQGIALFERYRTTGLAIPNNAITAYALALQETGNLEQAVQVLESRLQSLQTSDATAIQIRSSLAIAYQVSQQTQAALQVLEPLRGIEEARLPLARTLSTIGRQTEDTSLYEEAIALYRQVLTETANPSVGLLTEIADVFSELPSVQPQALELYRQLTGELTGETPQNQSLWVKRLVLENQLGELSRAELRQQLQVVLQTLPNSAIERRMIALALLRLDPPHPAFLNTYQALLTAGVDVPFLNYRIAQIYLRQNNLAEARRTLAVYIATSVGADDPASELLLAEIERREGSINAAAQRYEALLSRSSNSVIRRGALRGLAGIRLAQGQPEEALSLYSQLVADNPDDLISQLGQTGVAYQLEQISEADAEALLNRWLETDPSVEEPPPELFILVGALPADPRRESLYDALLLVNPDSIAVNRRWVQIWALRDPVRAQERVDLLLVRNPDLIGVRFLQGELAQILDDLALASEAYQAILEIQPDNPDALAALGGVRFEQRQYVQATALYKRVLELRPNDLETRRILAELSLVQDQPQMALHQFQEIEQIQAETGATEPNIENRVDRLRVDILRRRGFQPYWERY